MNAYAPPERQVTDSERIQMLIDAITAHHALNVAVDRYSRMVDPKTATASELRRFDEQVQLADRGSDKLCAIAKTLMADGLLDRCAELLRENGAGTP